MTLDAKSFDSKGTGVLVADGIELSGAVQQRGGPRIHTKVAFPHHGTYRVDVVAKGSRSKELWPILGVFAVRGFAYDRTTVDSTDFATYSFTIKNVPGIAISDVAFQLQNGADGDPRSLTIKRVTIRDTPVHPTPTLTRGPILQNPDAHHSTATITWWTDQPADSVVEYDSDPRFATACVAGRSGNRYRHSVKLTGLTANTVYHYRVKSSGFTLATGRFTTFPQPDADATIKFAAFGDFGRSMDTPQGPNARRAAQRIAEDDVQLLIPLGDNAYPNLHYFTVDRCWFDHYHHAHRNAFLFPVWGNHDQYSHGVTKNLPLIFELPKVSPIPPKHDGFFYSLDVGPVHFTFLYGFSPEELAWLERDLAGATARGMRWKIVAMHQSPVVHKGVLTVRGPIFEKYGVDAVLYGDTHRYSRTNLLDLFPEGSPDGKGTRWINSGAAANGGTVGLSRYSDPATAPKLCPTDRNDAKFGGITHICNAAPKATAGKGGPIYVVGTISRQQLILEAVGVPLDGTRKVLETTTITK